MDPSKTDIDRKDPGKSSLKGRSQRFLVFVRRRVPVGLRLVLGLILIIGGIFGFLPIVGFWMIPLGIMVAALDIKPVLRWLKNRRS